jgi:hypothetical protein
MYQKNEEGNYMIPYLDTNRCIEIDDGDLHV